MVTLVRGNDTSRLEALEELRNLENMHSGSSGTLRERLKDVSERPARNPPHTVFSRIQRY